MKPTIGRIVHYTLAAHDVSAIDQTRDSHAHARGNHVQVGDTFPATIVRTWGDTPESAVNLQVHLDGNHTHWATSATPGEGPGHWAWPARD